MTRKQREREKEKGRGGERGIVCDPPELLCAARAGQTESQTRV